MIAGIRLFGAELQELGREPRSPLRIFTGDNFVFEAGLLEEDRYLVPVRRRPVIQIDHVLLLSVQRHWHQFISPISCVNE
jgi:hypothetical protein